MQSNDNNTFTSCNLTPTSTTSAFGPLKVVRNLSLKRMRGTSSSLNEKVRLDRVLGLTLSSNSALSSSQTSGCVAYPAGCVAVLLDVRRNKQSHVINSCKKSITSLAFSADGKHLITGECGHQPCVRIWDAKTCTQLAEFEGHKYGVTCVAFSPDASFAVSIGSQHDMIVNVYDWKNNVKVASNKVSAKVRGLSFSQEGSYFVTVGTRHVKFWYLDYSRPRSSGQEAVPLMGRSAILGDQRNNNFCDVGCGKGAMAESTYTITESGLLCEFNGRRLLDKWVELRTTRANCVSVGETLICIGCAEGIIRVFNPANLHFICTLPRPHALGTDLCRALPLRSEVTAFQPKVKYADAIAVTVLEESKKVICVYSDHSMYVWDVKDFKKVGKSQSYLYHSACIWGIESYKCGRGSQPLLPPGTFLTCSSDDTIRVWNLDSNQNFDGYVYKRNIFSNELLKIIYTDPELKYLCENELTSSANENGESGYDGKNGVRCLKISPDGQHLASGDRSGNIYVKDLSTQVDICKIEAHDSEVLCLEYSDPQKSRGNYLLCSASRDRLIHLFDVEQQYSFVQTLDDHTSAITAIKFVPDPENTSLQLISCGADKSIIFRKMSTEKKGSVFTREHHVVGKTTLYDMELDYDNRSVLTACQDRQVRVYSVDSGKLVSTVKGSLSEEGTLIKIAMDPSGQYFASSATDKSLNIFDYQSGESVASAAGHSELITGLKFSNNGRNLISVSGDGCIFVWKLPAEVANTISSKLGLPPVPPEKPAFIASLRSLPDKGDSRSVALPLIPKIRLDSNGTSRSPIEALNGLRKSDTTGSLNRMQKESEYEKVHSNRDAKNEDRDTDSSKTVSLKSDEEIASGSDIVYYPQDDDSLQRSNFEIRREKGSFGNNSGSLFAFQNLKNSLSVPNFNDLHSEDDDSERSGSVAQPEYDASPYVRHRNPLYASNEQLEGQQVQRHNNLLHNNFENLQHFNEENGDGVNRSSLSSQFMNRGVASASAAVTMGATTPSRDINCLSRSTSVSSLSGSKRREELSRAVGEARRKLESLGWKTNNLSSSKSFVDLRNTSSRTPVTRLTSSSSFAETPDAVVTRSCSMNDLSFGRPKRILQRETSGTPAPIWDQNRSERDLSLRKSPSVSSLARNNNSRLRLPARSPQGVWGTPSPLIATLTPRRSGRASAPLQRARLNGSLHGTQSSDDESSSDDDESSSSFIRTLRPGTPPKPSIMRQVRRSSTSHVVPNQMPRLADTMNRSGRTRKLWDNFELRSSKSEYNLSIVGRDLIAPPSRSNSRVNLVAPSAYDQNRIDFSSANPATIDLNRDTCEQAVEELTYMAIFVRKLFKRSQAAGNMELSAILSDGVARTYQTLSGIREPDSPTAPRTLIKSLSVERQRSKTETGEASSVTMNLLQEYSDRLMSIVEKRMAKENRTSTDL